MDRRTFLTAGTALASGTAISLAAAGPAAAAGKCVSVAYGGMCTSELPAFARIARNFPYEQQDRWCWAAAMSMIFAYYGYKLGQEAIIARAYNGSFDLSGDFVDNARLLNRPWVDENGRAFDSTLHTLFAVTDDAQTVATGAMIAALDR